MVNFKFANILDSLIKKTPKSIVTKSGNNATIDSPRFIITKDGDNISVCVTICAKVRNIDNTEAGYSLTEKQQKFEKKANVSYEIAMNAFVKTIDNMIDEILNTIAAWG